MMDKENEMTGEQAKRLLTAIFNDEDEDELDENYPDTLIEKVGYSEYALTSDLGLFGKAINRLSRLYSLLMVSEKGEGKLPDIILHNELRMALEPLMRVQADTKEILDWLVPVCRETKPPKVEAEREDG